MTVSFTEHSEVQLIRASATDLDVARAAWVSNEGSLAVDKDVEPERLEGLIKFLMRERHNSPFEHGQFTFYIKTPLFVAREFQRHRTFSYNEVSGRYKQMEPNFYLPSVERPNTQKGKIGSYTFEADKEKAAMARVAIEANSRRAWDWYTSMLHNGIAREVARDVLPLNLMTEFYATVNPRNLMAFLDLRNDAQALYEIQEVARHMESHLESAMPLTYRAYKEYR